MPAPSLTPSLLSSLGGSPSLSMPAPAAQASRDGQTGAFARELQQRLQAQVQAPPPSPPPVQPPARPVPAPAPAPAASSPPPANGRTSEGASATAPETRAGAAGQGEREGEGEPGAEDASPADEAAAAPTAGSAGDAQRHLQRQRAERGRLDPGLAAAASAAAAEGRADVDAETAAELQRSPARRLRAEDEGTTVAMPPATPTAPVALPADDVTATRGLGMPDGAGTGPLALSPAAASDAAVSDLAATPRRAGQDPLAQAAAVAVDDTALSGAAAAGAARAPRADDALRHAAEGDRPGAALAALAGQQAGQQAALDGERAGTVGRQLDDNPQAVGSVTPASGLPAFAGELARAASALGGPQPAAAPAHAAVLNLPTPVTAPEFVPRLSGELAVLARDGVQEARINVHPVELGPISVQIAVDGATAQVHLAVDNAQTRDLLEQSMPTLAAALRDTGLTLTGGGVFQQSRQAPQDQPSPQQATGLRGRGDGGSADERDGVAPAAPTRRLRAVGAVDVFA